MIVPLRFQDDRSNDSVPLAIALFFCSIPAGELRFNQCGLTPSPWVFLIDRSGAILLFYALLFEGVEYLTGLGNLGG